MSLVYFFILFSILTFTFAQQHFGPQFGPQYGPPFHHFGPTNSERGPIPLPQRYSIPNQQTSHRHLGSPNQDSSFSGPISRPSSSNLPGFSDTSSETNNQEFGSAPPQGSNLGFGVPSQPSNQPNFGPVPSTPQDSSRIPPHFGPSSNLPFPPPSHLPVGNANPIEKDGEGLPTQGIPPPPTIDWGSCPQLEPKEEEKIEKAAVIKYCLDLIPLPQNITQESVDHHRSDIARCALTKENWFNAEGKYKYEKAHNEIKSKKLAHHIEVRIFFLFNFFSFAQSLFLKLFFKKVYTTFTIFIQLQIFFS